MSNQLISKKIKKLVSLNKTEDAIQYLASQKLDDIEKQIIILNNRFNKTSEERILGIISNEDASLEYNKINSAIIDLAEKIEKGNSGIIKKSLVYSPNRSLRDKPIVAILGFLLLSSLGYFFLIDNKDKSNQVDEYVICVSAYKDKVQAKKRVVELGRKGYNGKSSFLWIPDYDCLSGKNLYQVYIGPYKNIETARKELCEYNRKFETTLYGVKLCHKGNREEFKCNK